MYIYVYYIICSITRRLLMFVPPQQCAHAEGFLWILMVAGLFRVRSGFAFWPPGYVHAGSEFPCEMFDCEGSHNLRATMRYLTHI